MPRTRPPDRLDQLADAALTVFGRAGFRLAQMDDIAAEMGVAKGTVYGYVTSKEALFALGRRGPADAGRELTGILDELWGMLAATRRGADMIERSARDWPELAEVFYVGFRRQLIASLASYLEQGARRGELRPVEHPEVTARFVLESVVWFASHRHGDPDSAGIDDDTARPAVT